VNTVRSNSRSRIVPCDDAKSTERRVSTPPLSSHGLVRHCSSHVSIAAVTYFSVLERRPMYEQSRATKKAQCLRMNFWDALMKVPSGSSEGVWKIEEGAIYVIIMETLCAVYKEVCPRSKRPSTGSSTSLPPSKMPLSNFFHSLIWTNPEKALALDELINRLLCGRKEEHKACVCVCVFDLRPGSAA
jgi:hypothetical protein